MSFWKNIFIFMGASISVEVAFLIYKKIQQNFNHDINDFVAFDDSRYSCNKAKQNDCSNPFCRLHNLKKIVDKLESAKLSIDLCMYVFSCPELTDAIIRAHRRGVVVRVITDPEVGFCKSSGILNLYKGGILVRWKKSSENIMHHKFCIVDGPQRISEVRNLRRTIDGHKYAVKLSYRNGLVITGSMNWTPQATNGNWESVILTSNSNIVPEFENIFNKLWEDFDPCNKINFPKKTPGHTLPHMENNHMSVPPTDLERKNTKKGGKYPRIGKVRTEGKEHSPINERRNK